MNEYNLGDDVRVIASGQYYGWQGKVTKVRLDPVQKHPIYQVEFSGKGCFDFTEGQLTPDVWY